MANGGPQSAPDAARMFVIRVWAERETTSHIGSRNHPATALQPLHSSRGRSACAVSGDTMGRTEADEVAELKSMFGSPARGTIPINRRPQWDSTPLRHRPPALCGLKPVTREPWAIDEDVYNRRFETRDVGVRTC